MLDLRFSRQWLWRVPSGNMKPYSLEDVCRSFWATRCFYLRGLKVSRARSKLTASTSLLAFCFPGLFFGADMEIAPSSETSEHVAFMRRWQTFTKVYCIRYIVKWILDGTWWRALDSFGTVKVKWRAPVNTIIGQPCAIPILIRCGLFRTELYSHCNHLARERGLVCG
jgi:hypothetical protein